MRSAHVDGSAPHNCPVGTGVRGAVDVAVAGSQIHDSHKNCRGGGSRSTAGTEYDPAQSVTRGAVGGKGSDLRPGGGRVGAHPQTIGS